MKALRYTLILLLLLPFKSYACDEVSDTILSVDTPSKVLITENSEGTTITVTGFDGDYEESHLIKYSPGSNVRTSRNSSFSWFSSAPMDKDWVIGTDGLCIGLTDAHDLRGDGGLQWSKSFEISWLSCINIGYKFSRSRIYVGLGFDWRNYKATADSRWLVTSPSGGVEWGEAPEGVEVRYTRLKVFSLQVPLLYEWYVPKSQLSLKFGPILNFNTRSSIKGSGIDADGNSCEYFTKDIGHRPTTLDFFASISYNYAIGIYVRYSPMKVLKDPSPINFTPLTIGFGFQI